MSVRHEKIVRSKLIDGKSYIQKPDGSWKRAPKGKTDWKRLRAMRDEDIDYSDIPELDENFWKHAKLVMPEPKDRLTIRLDHDIVKWLKQQGRGYQTRINAILRGYMEAHKPGRPREKRV